MAFHFVFGRESRKHNLLNLLNAILAKTEQAPIKDLTLQETTLDAETLGRKSCRLDIRALTSENHYINILDFPFVASEKVHNIYRLLEVETFETLTDVLEIHFLELPKLQNQVFDLTCPLTRWLLALSDKTDQKLKEAILMQDKDIQTAYKDLERLAADKDAKRLYEIREKAAKDWNSSMYASRQEGLEEGIQQGLQQGSQQEKRLLVHRMLGEGFDEDLIKKIAGLTQDELDEIKAQIQ